MMVRRKPLAALVAATAALAVALPAASASAATAAPAVQTAYTASAVGQCSPTGCSSLLCSMLNGRRLTATWYGQPILARLLAQTMFYLRCGPGPYPF
jgi:hypothetical protein